jgi:fucose permease
VVRKSFLTYIANMCLVLIAKPCLSSYLDRINVSNARLAGMQEDLGMTDTVWNAGISTFYVGYLIGQLPGNLFLAKANPRWFLPAIMLGWSATTICTPALTNGVGFCVCRFFTGLLEAPFFPGITLSTLSTATIHTTLTWLTILTHSDLVMVYQA